jgi:hypothetical protein
MHGGHRGTLAHDGSAQRARGDPGKIAHHLNGVAELGKAHGP